MVAETYPNGLDAGFAGCSVGDTTSVLMNLEQVSLGSTLHKDSATNIVASIVCGFFRDNFGGTVRPRELSSKPLR